jgi:hypothetical protein
VRLERSDHISQQRVARRVALAVVDLLEPVDVDEGEHQASVRGPSAVDLALERGHSELPPVDPLRSSSCTCQKSACACSRSRAAAARSLAARSRSAAARARSAAARAQLRRVGARSRRGARAGRAGAPTSRWRRRARPRPGRGPPRSDLAARHCDHGAQRSRPARSSSACGSGRRAAVQGALEPLDTRGLICLRRRLLGRASRSLVVGSGLVSV